VPPAAEVDPAPSDAPAALRSVTRWLKALAILVIASWALLAIQFLPRNGAGTDHTGGDLNSSGDLPPTTSPREVASEGPWGRLTYVPITIAPPLEFVPQAAPNTSTSVEWRFPNMISARLPAFLSEIGLSEPLREKLVSLADVDPGIQGLTIRPPREVVLGLSPDDRSALYAALAGFPENIAQRCPFQFCGDSFDEWLGDSPLSPETRKLAEPLVYRHGSFLFFTDLRTIEESLPSPEQRLKLIKALSHESTFLLQLELSEESDLEALVDYWSRGGRTENVRPILESLHQAGGQRSIDVTYLLPPFARRRIYTYDAFSDEKLRPSHNCHWTALNFFSDQPDDRKGDMQEVARALKEDYYVVYGNLRLGDLVAFFDDRLKLIHSAVFIADNVLFTKNGPASAHPWMFMKLKDMKSYYPTRDELRIRCFRRKDL